MKTLKKIRTILGILASLVVIIVKLAALSDKNKLNFLSMLPVILSTLLEIILVLIIIYGCYYMCKTAIVEAKKEAKADAIKIAEEKFAELNKIEIEKISDLEKKIQALSKADEIHFVSRMILIEMIKNATPETKVKIAALMRTQDMAIPAIKWETPKEIVDITNQQNGDLFIKHIEDKRKGNK